MLSLRRVRVLEAIAEAGSIIGAADQLGYTPSAVSQQLNTLERELGVALITRGARGSSLTAAGAELAARGRSLLAQAEAAVVATQNAAALRGGLLRVCTFPSAGATLLPRALAKLRAADPALEIRLLEREPLQAAVLMQRREVDLALTFAYPGLPRLELAQELIATPVRAEAMLVALPAGTTGGGGPVTLGEVGLDWIDNRDWGPSLRLLAFLAAREGVTVRVAFETDDYRIALALVAAGLGAAIVPEDMAAGETGVALRRLVSRPRREIIAITYGKPAGSAQTLLGLLGNA
jgi:DNA-binding transcriptional LysR family regulator